MANQPNMEKLREGVRKCLPEVEQIKDTELRDKVMEAWALALSESEFMSIDDIPAQAAQGIADGLEAIHPSVKIDRDLLWACALCHDLGKPYEMSPRNQARWKADTVTYGYPAIRHPGYGIHVAFMAKLPEVVAQTAGYHSMEGEWVKRSLLTTIVHFADYSYWHLVDRVGLLVAPMYAK
jgi:hypothetical protein